MAGCLKRGELGGIGQDDNPAFSGDEATGTEQALKIKATASNPLASERSGKITVSAGTSIAEIGYTGLKEEIVVKQAGSRVEGSSMEVKSGSS